MKLIILSIIILSLAGCETIDAEGNRTRFDYEGAAKGVSAALDTWQRIDRQSHIIGYDQFGNPIYR